MRIRIATRGSALARWQADHVASLLQAVDSSIEVELVIVSTQGDRDKSTPLEVLGGKGIFVKEVQAALLDGRADIAVHSGKDMPSIGPSSLVVAAVPERGDPADVLVGGVLADLAPGSLIGTGSIRRRAQLASIRPDLTFATLRGNIDTRLAKLDSFDAIVMAAAAIERLGITPEIVDRIPVDLMTPQVAQGALSIECRSDDSAVADVLAKINHGPSRACFDAERAYLAEIGGDCELPVAGYAVAEGDTVHLHALIASADGSAVLEAEQSSTNPAECGRQLARYLLDEAGGAELLAQSRTE